MDGDELRTILDLRAEVTRLKGELDDIERSVTVILFADESQAQQEMLKLRVKWYASKKSTQFHRDEPTDEW